MIADLDLSPILGRQVVTEDSACKCGADLAIILSGKAMHAAALMCSACGGFRQWLSHEAVEGIADLYCAMTRTKGIGPPGTITIRTKKNSASAECSAAEGEAAEPSSSARNERPKSMKMSEAFPSKYLKSDDLQGREAKVILQNVQMEKVGDDTKPILYFKSKEKGLVLNVTNKNALVDLYGDDSGGWFGKPAVLFSAMVDFKGKSIPSIRVRGLTARDKPDGITTGPQKPDPDLNDEVPFDL